MEAAVAKDRLSFDLPAKRHKWSKGKFEKESRYYSRTDKCKLCGCQRVVVKAFINKQLQTFVTSYERSGQSFAAEQKPDCWGSLNP